MTETQLRFLRAIAERLPLSRIAELYLFPPMRQGALETGIAIVAAVREVEPDLAAVLAAAPDVAPEATPEDANDDSAAALGDAMSDEVREAVGDADTDEAGEACDPTEDASRDAAAGMDVVADDVVPEPVVPPAAAATAVAPRERHTVYTARYRLALKGPERGRWELNVMEEADAPLLTVEVVVRGVQHRAGEGAEPERLEPAALRDLLGAPAA